MEPASPSAYVSAPPTPSPAFSKIYLFDTEIEHKQGKQQREEGEAGSMHWEPDVGFDPGSPGSRPGPKAGAKPLRHPGIPIYYF